MWLALILACGSKHAEPAPEPIPEPVEAPAPAPAPSAVGMWTSASCGERTYERQLEIKADGSWHASDLVSPCPAGAQCVWSGIVMSNGTWTEDGDGLALTESGPGGPQARARPTRVRLDGDGLLSTEPDGECAYLRAQ